MWLLPDHNYLGKAVIQNSCNQSGSIEVFVASDHSILICQYITKRESISIPRNYQVYVEIKKD